MTKTPKYPRLERLAVSAITPAPYNPRKISDEAKARLAIQMSELGNLQPIVFNVRTKTLIGGHQRLRIYQDQGAKTVEAWCVDLPPDKEKAANLALNNFNGEWDGDLLGKLVEEVKAAGLDIALTGFEEKQLAALLEELKPEPATPAVDAEPQTSRADELQAQWQVKRGQVWELGKHRIACGDSGTAADVEALLAGERPTCIFTDPPYGVAIGDKNKFLNTFQKAGRCLENISGDCLGKDELFDMLVRVFTTAREHANPCCAVYVCAPQGGELGLMMMMMIASGMPTRHVLNWIKDAPTFSMGRLDYEYQHEPILYTWTKKHKHYGLGEFKTSTWNVAKPRESKLHPTMKPVALYVGAYLNSSASEAIVYEPFSGSGTAIIAAEQTGRCCRAMDIDPKFVAVAIQRWAEATGKTPQRLH